MHRCSATRITLIRESFAGSIPVNALTVAAHLALNASGSGRAGGVIMRQSKLSNASSIAKRGRRASPFGEFWPAFGILFAIVAAEIVAAGLIGHRFLGDPPSNVLQLADVTLGVSGWFIIPFAWLGLVAVTLTRKKAEQPTMKLWRIIRLNRDWLLRGFLLAVIHIPLGRAFATFKTSIPLIHPFDWDPAFAALDQGLFGTDVWRLTHAFIGDLGTVAIDRIYALWGTYLILLAGWISFTRNRAVQIKAALAFNLCWLLLGSVLATYFASVGPCFYDAVYGADRFAPLMDGLDRVDREHLLLAFKAMSFLSESPETAKLGGGISAMPSMHVSMATLGVAAAFAMGARRWVKLLAIGFVLLILIGSVHLGWHYAVDGLASIPLTAAIWYGSSLLVDKTRAARIRD